MSELFLSCGHPLSEVENGPAGASCRACSIDGDAGVTETAEGEPGQVIALHDQPPQPFHSVRADAPGPRGCWAVATHGGSCGAPAMRGHSYCAAHSGKGVSGDPQRWSPIGRAAHREQLSVRATMRSMYGSNRGT